MKKILNILLFVLLLFVFKVNVYAEEISVTIIHENGMIEIPRTIKTQPTFTDSEILALQQIAIAEAGNQGPIGMAYVMQTIINRTDDERFPSSILDVINEEGQFSTSSYYKKYEINEESKKAFEILNMLDNKGQLFFEKTNNNSWQSRNLTLCFEYKLHTFYM